MNKKSGYKVMTTKEFNTIKALISAGIRLNRVAEIVGRSQSAISRVNTFATLDDMHRVQAERARNYATLRAERQQQEVPPAQPSDGEPTNGTQRASEILSSVRFSSNENLERIATALERIAKYFEPADVQKIEDTFEDPSVAEDHDDPFIEVAEEEPAKKKTPWHWANP